MEMQIFQIKNVQTYYLQELQLLEKVVVIPDGSIVGKNVRIFAGVKVHDDNRLIEPGETINGNLIV